MRRVKVREEKDTDLMKRVKDQKLEIQSISFDNYDQLYRWIRDAMMEYEGHVLIDTDQADLIATHLNNQLPSHINLNAKPPVRKNVLPDAEPVNMRDRLKSAVVLIGSFILGCFFFWLLMS